MTNERLLENIRRLHAYNRDMAGALYYGLAHTPRPEPPLLLGADGIETRYQPTERPRAEPNAPQRSFPVGGGPDRWNYFTVLEPDYHAIGDLFQAPNGGVYCKVETPDGNEGFTARWVRVT